MSALLNDAKALAKALKTAANQLEDIFDRHLDSARPIDFAYEAYVDLRILTELGRDGWTLAVVNGTRLQLPLKPGLKKTFAYVTATKGNRVFQICFGTEIRSATTATAYAPDVSIQLGSSGNAPSEADVAFCYDQKYTSKENLTRDSVLSVASLLQLVCPRGSLGFQPFVANSPFRNGNAVITNGLPCALSDRALQALRICEISEAAPGRTPKSRP